MFYKYSCVSSYNSIIGSIKLLLIYSSVKKIAKIKTKNYIIDSHWPIPNPDSVCNSLSTFTNNKLLFNKGELSESVENYLFILLNMKIWLILAENKSISNFSL